MGIAFNGSSTKLAWSGQLFSAYPCAVFCWVKPTTNANQQIWSVTRASDYADGFRVAFNSGVGVPKANLMVGGSDTGAMEANDATDSAAWQPLMCVFTSTNSRTIYYKGTVAVTDSSNGGTPTWANINEVTVGKLSALGSQLFTGDVAELAAWQGTVPDATDWGTLRGGALPETIKAGTLVEHWGLEDTTTSTAGRGLVGRISRTLTATSASNSATHPIDVSSRGSGGSSATPLGTITPNQGTAFSSAARRFC